MLKTDKLNQFIFREDNREKINHSHVRALIESIKACNLLEMRPILVNEKLEIIDGQHRVLAAMALKIPIYYQVEKNLNPKQILLLNTAKSWTAVDYLNFYVKNDYPEYKKLNGFIQMNQISLRVALCVTMGSTDEAFKKFKNGEFTFEQNFSASQFHLGKETQDIIRKMNGHSKHTESAKFWKALLTLIKHDKFDSDKWRANLKKMAERFVPKVSSADYLKLFVSVYNWHNTQKIHITEEEIE